MDALAPFHPALRTWFERRFPLGPSEPQARGWPLIAEGRDTLIAAPTGSGKTLAAFFVCIDQVLRRAEGRAEPRSEFAQAGVAEGPATPNGIEVVYVSPLKALAADIRENLERPLEEIAEISRELGQELPPLSVALRSGDTSSSERARMLRRPPHFLITTPESLYLLLTAERSRELLRGVRNVIVDEIHAVARDKRGSHLALSLERLDALCDTRPVRVGLSATQRPIETVARLLVGAGPERSLPDGRPRCDVVDEGHRRHLDLALELPGSELAAVASKEQMDEVLDRIAGHVLQRRTTLVFVNTRRMAERMAHRLAERLAEISGVASGSGGSGQAGESSASCESAGLASPGDCFEHVVAAHHGSLSKERRLRVEDQLRAGELKALVATASLELGIDIGPVELVCQIGSPRSLATFLQRVGRSGHRRGETPVGRLYPLTRDELVECAALLRGVAAGRLDALRPPLAPLDILAQQIVAACAAEEWQEEELYALVRGSAPFADLSREDFDAVVEMLAEGVVTGRGRRGAYLHRDQVNGVLRARRGARIAALTSGGAIPETADYRVVASPDDTFVGTVNEDWAIESMAGDIFLLGSTSWRIARVESGVVRVDDAHGASPTIPFWLGEAPARTEELSIEVSELRARLEGFLGRDDDQGARDWLQQDCELDEAAAVQLVAYLASAYTALGGHLPKRDELVFERFFDESGGMQLVVHAPLGGRLNRGLGLALRKRFCVGFDFELQAAANDDAVLLSLGPQHSFPLADVGRFLHSNTVAELLRQAVLTSPMFTARWRWNLNRALMVLRYRGGKRNPPPIQRMEADDMMAAVFPRLAACQENTTGPVEIPGHPLVRQTMDDCLHEAMDVDALEELVRGIEGGAVRTRFLDTTEPSPLAHEILNGMPYTFLDDAPLEERRSRAISLRRALPVQARELGRLDPEAIDRVREEAEPQPRDSDELHDWLLGLVVLRPRKDWRRDFERLREAGRARTLVVGDTELWCASERWRMAEALFSAAPAPPASSAMEAGSPRSASPPLRWEPADPWPSAIASLPECSAESAALDAVRAHLDCAGVVSEAELAERCALALGQVQIAVGQLEAEGFALRGQFDHRIGAGEPSEEEPAAARDEPLAEARAPEQICARRLLTRIHRYTQDRLRSEIEPVSAQDFVRFLLQWQGAAPGSQRGGPRGVAQVIEQLQGFELAAGAWEESILPARVEGYRSDWLDSACLSGEVAWGRISVSTSTSISTSVPTSGSQLGAAESEDADNSKRGGRAPSRATPLSLLLRSDLPWLLEAGRGEARPVPPAPGAAFDLLQSLEEAGALFHAELVSRSGRLPVEVEEGLWELVSRGWVTADGFQAVRSLLGARERWARRRARSRARRGLRRGGSGASGSGSEGRWALLRVEAGGGADSLGSADLSRATNSTNSANAAGQAAAGAPVSDPERREELAEAVAEQLLARWGVVFRELLTRESVALPWRELQWALRRLEARGIIRGGRFVSGFAGEQFALSEAVEALRRMRNKPREGEVVRVSGCDPLNLVGILIPGPRVPATRNHQVVYTDGLPTGSSSGGEEPSRSGALAGAR